MATYPNATNASEHFRWSELEIDPAKAPAAIKAAAVRWCDLIGEPVRRKYGRPVHITSGYRSTASQAFIWARSVAQNGLAYARAHVARPGSSRHEKGDACDFWVKGVSIAELAAFVATLPGVGGIGIYSSWLHADLRPLGPDGRIDRW